ncbi:hypothetical protein [Halomonas denitrificans]|nr:hypothetical protein [Halomonas denitrificans]
MRDALQTMTEQLAASPGLLLAAGFLVAFVEAAAIVGLLVPGIFLLFLIAALVGWNPSMMVAMSAAFALGAMAGDGLSYALGRRYRHRLAALPPTSRSGRWLDSGRAFFRRHGGRSVFIARFVGPVRPIVPVVAGSLGMPAAAFVPRMVIASLLWAPAMVIPGALFGQSLEVAAEFGTRVVVLLLLAVLGGWLLVSLVRGAYAWGSRRSTWWFKRLGGWLRRHPRFGRLAGPLLVPGQREVIPVLGLAAMLLLSFTALLAVLTLAIVNAPPALSEAVGTVTGAATLSGSLRTPLADPLFVVLGLAGSAPVAVALGLGVTLFLAAAGRSVALVHWLLAVVLGTALAQGLYGLLGLLPMRVARPDVAFASLVLMHGFLAVIAAKDLAATQRKWLYLAATAALVLIGFARLYLGRADLYALGVAAALAVVWLTLVGIAYRVRARPARTRSAWALVAVFVLLAAGGSVVANGMGYSRVLQGQQQGPPVRSVAESCWWSRGRDCDGTELPRRRTVFGDPGGQVFDAQVAADAEVLRNALDEADWQPLPPLGVRAIRAVLARRVDADRLPHLARDFNGRTQEVARRLPLGDDRWAVLRAWRSGWQLTPDGRPVWLIQVRVVTPTTVAGLFATWRRDASRSDEGIDALRRAGSDWRWRRDGDEDILRADARRDEVDREAPDPTP